MSRASPDSRTSAVAGRPRRISKVWSRLTRWTGVAWALMAIVSGACALPVSRRRSWPSRPSQFPRTASPSVTAWHCGQPPLGERGDDRFELQAPLGELVQTGGDRWRSIDGGDQPVFFHVLQAGGQQVGGDPREAIAQVGEPARSLAEQLADDQQHPAVAYQVE